MVFLMILFAIVIVGGLLLLFIEKKRSQKKATNTKFNEYAIDIEEFYQIDDIKEGIIYKDGQCYMMSRIGGLNFTVMSERAKCP